MKRGEVMTKDFMTGEELGQKLLESVRQMKRGESLTDWEALRRNAQLGVEPVDDPDAPDVSALMRDEVARRRVGPPPGSES